MDISFKRINNELQDIVNQFEQLLEEGKYDEAKKTIDDIVHELTVNTDIELDQDSENDNNFHRLYKELTKKINEREESQVAPAPGNVTDYSALKQVLELAIDQIFKTSEIRQELILKDPEQSEYRQALQEGITNSKKEKEQLQELQNEYNFIENEIFFDKTTNPATDRRLIIEESKLYEEQLQEIIDIIDEIARLQEWIANPAHADSRYDSDKTKYSLQINLMKYTMQNQVTELKKSGLDSTTLTNLTEDANIASGNSKSKVEELKNKQLIALATQYEEIRKQLQKAQDGTITYTDKNGNVINIQDEEVFVLMDDMALIDIDNPKLYPTKSNSEKIIIENKILQIEQAMKKIEKKSEQIRKKISMKDQEIEIYTDHINIIDIENSILDRNPEDREAYINNFDEATKQKLMMRRN